MGAVHPVRATRAAKQLGDRLSSDKAAATRAAKKMTAQQLRDRLSAAGCADLSGLKPALVERWVSVERALSVKKQKNRVSIDAVVRVADAVGWRVLAGYADLATCAAIRATSRAYVAAGRGLDADPEWWRSIAAVQGDLYSDLYDFGFNRVPPTHSCWPLAGRMLVETRIGRRAYDADASSRQRDWRFGRRGQRPAWARRALGKVHALLSVAVGENAEAVSYATRGEAPAELEPRLWVPSLGTELALPLDPEAVRRLVAGAGERAPLGKGTETVVDLDARRTWRFALGKDVLATSPEWNAALTASRGGGDASILDQVLLKMAPALSGRGAVVAQPYQMLVYEEGDFFHRHMDTARAPNHIGSLVVSLPVRGATEGGELVLHDPRAAAGARGRAEPSAASDGPPLWTAFYTDVEHEVQRVRRGLRVTLTYHLHAATFAGAVPRPPRALLRARSAGETGSVLLLAASLGWCLERVTSGSGIIVALTHKYTENTLPYVQKRDPYQPGYFKRDPSHLRGEDAIVYATLVAAVNRLVERGGFDSDGECDDSADGDGDGDADYPGKLPICIDLVSVRDFEEGEGGKQQRFNFGEICEGEWCHFGRDITLLNPDDFTRILKRTDPTYTRLYTGNEGMEAGYIYTSAVIKIGSVNEDY